MLLAGTLHQITFCPAESAVLFDTFSYVYLLIGSKAVMLHVIIFQSVFALLIVGLHVILQSVEFY